MQNRTRNFTHVAFATSSFPCSGTQLTRVSEWAESEAIDDETARAIARPLMGRATMAANVTVDNHGNFSANARVELTLGRDLLVFPDKRETQNALAQDMIDEVMQSQSALDLRVVTLLKGLVVHSGNVLPLYRARQRKVEGEECTEFERYYPYTMTYNLAPSDGAPAVARSNGTTKITVGTYQYQRLGETGHAQINKADGRVMQRFLYKGVPVLAVGFPVTHKVITVKDDENNPQTIAVVQNADQAFIALIYGSTLDFVFTIAEHFGEEQKTLHEVSHKGMNLLSEQRKDDRVRAIANAESNLGSGKLLLSASIGDRTGLTDRQKRALEAAEAQKAAVAGGAPVAEAKKSRTPRKGGARPRKNNGATMSDQLAGHTAANSDVAPAASEESPAPN